MPSIIDLAAPRLAACRTIVQTIRAAFEACAPVSTERLLLQLLARTGAASQGYLEAGLGGSSEELFGAKVDVFILSMCLQLLRASDASEYEAMMQEMLAGQLADFLDEENARFRDGAMGLNALKSVAWNAGKLLDQLAYVRTGMSAQTLVATHAAAMKMVLAPEPDSWFQAILDDDSWTTERLKAVQHEVEIRVEHGHLFAFLGQVSFTTR